MVVKIIFKVVIDVQIEIVKCIFSRTINVYKCLYIILNRLNNIVSHINGRIW